MCIRVLGNVTHCGGERAHVAMYGVYDAIDVLEMEVEKAATVHDSVATLLLQR